MDFIRLNTQRTRNAIVVGFLPQLDACWFSGKNEICAFCTTELTSSDAKELKTLIQNEWKVQPSCGQPACLSLNPKANYNNGWTANEKTSRKRRQSAANQQPAKRRKKPSKPKRRKKSTGSNGKS